jgi:hypothetical protein
MASPYSETPATGHYADETPMPAKATGNLLLVAAGFGIGALVVLFGFVFLVGIGTLGHAPISGPSAAGQSAASAPAAPGPAPAPAPQTGLQPNAQGQGHAQAPAPAQPTTPKAPTRDTTGQAPAAEPGNGSQAPKPAPNRS